MTTRIQKDRKLYAESTRKSRKPKKGYVYIIEHEGYFKFGCSKSPLKRIKRISSKEKREFCIIHIEKSKDMFRDECLFKRKLWGINNSHDVAVIGEFFSCEFSITELINIIKEICSEEM